MSQQTNYKSGKERLEDVWTSTTEKAHEMGARLGLVNPTMNEQLKFTGEKIVTPSTQEKLSELDTQTHGIPLGREISEPEKGTQAQMGIKEMAHELGARVGVVEPIMKEEIKFGSEKMQGKTGTLKDATEGMKEKGAEAWSGAKEKGHELGARVGVVEPTMKEEIKFGAEKMQGKTGTVKDATVGMKEQGTKAWSGAKEKGHELGARVGVVEPTMKEEIKFGAEKMQGKTGTVKDATEEMKEQGAEVWSGAKEKAHEVGARVGVVEPTLKEEIKFGAEKMKDEERATDLKFSY